MYHRSPAGAGSTLNNIGGGYGTRTRVSLRNSIIAVSGPAYLQLCQGQLAENINNIIEGGTCSPMLDADPMLDESDGAATFMSPLPGSPAIKAGRPALLPGH